MSDRVVSPNQQTYQITMVFGNNKRWACFLPAADHGDALRKAEFVYQTERHNVGTPRVITVKHVTPADVLTSTNATNH